MRKLILFASAAALFLASGCATISNGPRQSVYVNTSSGEQVVATIDGKAVQIPAKVKLKRKKNNVILVEPAHNPCYEASQIAVSGFWSNWFWGNILTSGTTGSTTDGIVGSVYKYAGDSVIVPVRKKANCEQ